MLQEDNLTKIIKVNSILSKIMANIKESEAIGDRIDKIKDKLMELYNFMEIK